MNILITAGGTVEPIDGVRSITNTGTGRLGSLIADAFSAEASINRIFYICTKTAIQPLSDKITIVHIQNVNDLQSAVLDILKSNQIDAVIHSMAVSDYRVKSVSNIDVIAQSIGNNLREQGCNAENVTKAIRQAFDANNIVKSTGKISSQIESPMILLEKTPKILPMFKKLAPDAVIVGFKLLNKVVENELFDVAHELLLENHCDFVLANDASQIAGDRHKGYLLDGKRNITVFNTKQEIASGIVEAVLGGN